MPASGNQPDGPELEPCDSRPIDIDWTPTDFERWAGLIAEGEIPWPKDLSSDATCELTARVRTKRWDRLTRIIAELIAADIARDRS